MQKLFIQTNKMRKRRLNKKGVFYAEAIPQFFSYLGLILVLLIFFTLFNAKGCTKQGIEQKISSELSNLDVDVVVLNYLKTPVEVNGSPMTIADVISMIDDKGMQTERIGIFQQTAEQVFEKQYPSNHSKWKGVNPWWIRVYDSDEKPSQLGDSKYFRLKEGYNYGGYNCDPDKNSNIVKTIIVPKVNGGYAKLVFCIFESYLKDIK